MKNWITQKLNIIPLPGILPPPTIPQLRTNLEQEKRTRELLIIWGRHLLDGIGPYFKARANRQYPQRSGVRVFHYRFVPFALFWMERSVWSQSSAKLFRISFG